jgi:hypothetical protein
MEEAARILSQSRERVGHYNLDVKITPRVGRPKAGRDP